MRSELLRGLQWLRSRDAGLLALRRAGRSAIIMPALLALSVKVIGNPVMATFAAFGSLADPELLSLSGLQGFCGYDFGSQIGSPNHGAALSSA